MLKDSCDSLGTRSLPETDYSTSTDCDAGDNAWQENAFLDQGSERETLPVAFSDVSFFRESDTEDSHAFQHTLAIVKPEVAKYMYKFESVMARNGFVIITKDVLRLTREQAAAFYRDHESELYFPRLVDHMSGGPIAVYVLAKRDCVEEWRRLIGPADVRCAKRYFPVSLRAVYGTESSAVPVANAFHGSDSPAAAKREIRFFFPNCRGEDEEPDTLDSMQFIQEVMMPTISEGLSEMFKTFPNDPLRWFGNWLLTKTNVPK